LFHAINRNKAMVFENKHRILIKIIAIMLIAFVISCSSKQSVNIDIKGKEINPIEPVQLNWIGQWRDEGLKGKLIKDIARQFEFENPDIKINLKFPEDLFAGKDEMKYYAEIITAEKSEWDLIRINNGPEFLANYLTEKDYMSKYIVDLSQYPEIINNQNIAIFERSDFKSKWQNIIPGVAIDGVNSLLWCNFELAKKIGIEVKQFDMSFEDFLGYLKAVNEYNKANKTDYIGIFEVDGYTQLPSIPQQLFYSEAGNFESVFNNNLDDNKWEAFEKTVYALEKIAQYKPLPSKQKYTWNNDKSYPLKGTCLFYPQGSFMYNIWLSVDSLATKKMIPVQLPQFKPAPAYPGGYGIQWIIPKNSPHVQQAVRLMKYLATPQIADLWIRYTKSPTGIKNSLVSTAMGSDPYETFDYVINEKFGSKKMPIASGSSTFLGTKNSQIYLNFRQVMLGDISANEFLNTIKKQLK